MIITLCDRAGGVPAFPQPVYALGMPDPAAATGVADQRQAFTDVVMNLRQRIDFLILVPKDQLERAALDIRMSGAPPSPMARSES
jgi:hypothetical protein